MTFSVGTFLFGLFPLGLLKGGLMMAEQMKVTCLSYEAGLMSNKN